MSSSSITMTTGTILGRKLMSSQLEPWSNLSSKVVLVTGASSGIGREFCLDLAKAGCRVIAAARRVDRLNSLCDEINSQRSISAVPPRAVPLELDVSADAAMIQTTVKKAWDVFGRIDVLINNAGIRGEVKTCLDLSEEEWNNVFRTNLTGPWLVTKHVCVLMRDAKRGGSVINISSVVGVNRVISPGAVAYASSKTALNAMTKMMAIELGIQKIRVNSISPGVFRSEITEGLMKQKWLKNVV